MSIGDNIVKEANKWVGVYFNKGVRAQCAAWVSTVLNAAGVNGQNYHATSWVPDMANMGRKVELANILPGDIILFDRTYINDTLTHVGIYIGNGIMMHRNDAEQTVQKAYIQDGYWSSRINQVRRFDDNNITTTNSNYQNVFRACSDAPYSKFSNLPKEQQDKIVNSIITESTNNNIPASLIIAVISQESGFNPAAIGNDGEHGLMQLMDFTALEMGVNRDTIEGNIAGGARYLRKKLNEFGGNISVALSAYNGGSGGINLADAKAYSKSVTSILNDVNNKHPEISGASSNLNIDINKLNAAIDALGLKNPDQSVSLIKKVRDIDRVLYELRQLFSQKFALGTKTKKETDDWNSMLTIAQLFTNEVTGIISEVIKHYNNFKDQNVADEKIRFKYYEDMFYIIRASDNISHMKNVAKQYLGSINEIGTNIQNYQSNIQNVLKNTI